MQVRTRGTCFKQEKTPARDLLAAGVARLEGFEPPAFRIGICCDIQLRYRRIERDVFAEQYYSTPRN